jgi:alpha-D-ribose 1-methylphosphonate 5-triphosphate synthase subunit PhnG
MPRPGRSSGRPITEMPAASRATCDAWRVSAAAQRAMDQSDSLACLRAPRTGTQSVKQRLGHNGVGDALFDHGNLGVNLGYLC